MIEVRRTKKYIEFIYNSEAVLIVANLYRGLRLSSYDLINTILVPRLQEEVKYLDQKEEDLRDQSIQVVYERDSLREVLEHIND